jgi:uncharacterized protein (TIGR01244 family)
MRVLEVAPQVFACGQLFATDLGLLAKQGVRSIVCIRPDDEAPGQPAAAELARAAAEYGIEFVHFPVAAAAIGGEAAEALMIACDELERPLFVCGRSGGHSTRVWESAEPA